MDVTRLAFVARCCSRLHRLRRPPRPLAALGLAALLVAPAAAAAVEGTWSEVTGERRSRSSLDRSQTFVRAVDGSPVFDAIVRVAPGRRAVTVHFAPKKGLVGPDKTLRLSLDACKRYVIAARVSSTGLTWQPVVGKVEAIAGCRGVVPGGTVPAAPANPAPKPPRSEPG